MLLWPPISLDLTPTEIIRCDQFLPHNLQHLLLIYLGQITQDTSRGLVESMPDTSALWEPTQYKAGGLAVQCIRLI